MHGLNLSLEIFFLLGVLVDSRKRLLNLPVNGRSHLRWTASSHERVASNSANLAFLEVGILLLDGNLADDFLELCNILTKILSKLDCIELPDGLIFSGPVVNVETDELLLDIFAQLLPEEDE